MKKKIKTFFILLGTFVAGVLTTLAFIYIPKLIDYLKIETPVVETPDVKTPNELKPITDLTIGGWIPEWGNTTGIETLKREGDNIYDVSPVFYSVNNDGSLKDIKQKNWEEVIKITREKKIRITPSIALFDEKILTDVLNDEENLQRHVDAIIKEVVDNNYDGIDLNYESTFKTDKAEFFILLEKLADGLDKHDKLLIFTALPQWGDDINYSGYKQTRYVQDYERLGKIVDELRIMAYEYTFQGALYPGPIAPKEWVHAIAKYSASKVDPSKLVLAGRLYAYEWEYDPETFKEIRPLNSNPTAKDSTAKAYTYEQVQKILSETKGRNIFNKEIGENIYIYENEDEEMRVIFYPDSESLKIHKEIAAKFNFKGVAYWRFGGEKGLKL